ncbi:hypothetical protein NGA_0364200, partial [Nannochloropsis gaditana CCMP526]
MQQGTKNVSESADGNGKESNKDRRPRGRGPTARSSNFRKNYGAQGKDNNVQPLSPPFPVSKAKKKDALTPSHGSGPEEEAALAKKKMEEAEAAAKAQEEIAQKRRQEEEAAKVEKQRQAQTEARKQLEELERVEE